MLTIKHIKKKHKKIQALQDVSIQMEIGKCYGLIGPNGAGKSSLLKILASINQPDDGKVLINNESLSKKHKGLIGYIPQELSLEETVSAYQNLLFFGKLYGLKGKQLKSSIYQVLQLIGLTERAKEKVFTFSGGMKRRLNIGCALLHQPSILIMDEPTVGIDPQSRQFIFQLIHELKQQHTLIIYASHYMEEIEQICDEAVFIDHGNIIKSATIQELANAYASPSVFIKGDTCLPDHASLIGRVTNKHGGYIITTNHPLSTMESIIQHCHTNNILPEQLELLKPRLEDTFFSLTGSQLRD
ncbi:ABC transporter ATP-binding protein [Virgibacillus salexigens]|uniref:ABC transporter ATP-binding protein n=1 Tax=Virgibacillus massiliensis TaxID=1462526 RepID=UPI00136C16A6|nr:ABC transporter ATP-binding protein [Virgibacillus massiliensis]MYL43315.1 ATP-binding cassette domain-containing protein [Virgibacillus massiliensis]